MTYLEKMTPVANPNSARKKFLIVSGHDYRSKRKANIHFIAAEMAHRGAVRWFSVGLSALSALKGRDPRLGLERRANKVELHEGVECYLWKSLIHPFRLPQPIQQCNRIAFPLYARSAPEILNTWASEADTILVESGMPVAFIRRLRRASPHARIIYIASDDLQTIGSDAFLIEELEQVGDLLSGARVTSPLLGPSMPRSSDVFFVPHGIDPSISELSRPSPYRPDTINAVSVGSMLFDPKVFEVAAAHLPNVIFHVIGSGHSPPQTLPNLIYYPEMRYEDTIKYIANANIGVAPYRRANAPYYLADTSMKVMQYEYFNLNTVCPDFVAQDRAGRFGYAQGVDESIISAFRQALDALKPFDSARRVLTWSQVTDRLLDPNAFPDTHMTRSSHA